MTEKLTTLQTPTAPPSQTAFSLLKAASDHDVSREQETVEEEEPYTIKCICNFVDDDGSTIYCDKCDTWQHIMCYYPNKPEGEVKRDEFEHACVECEPRLLDRQRAIEQQMARASVSIAQEESADKKPKRPSPKSQKKKKTTDLQLNGHMTENSKLGLSHDQPATVRKSKAVHRPSQSVASQAPKRSLPQVATKGIQGHPSPATTPPDFPGDLLLHDYSPDFLSLYNDPAVPSVHTNSFAGLSVSNIMSAWLRDPGRMQKETGCEYNDVFQPLPANIDSLKRPLEVERSKKWQGPDLLQWQFLRAPEAIGKDVPLMELNGQIGFQSDYCQDAANRYHVLTSPLPFVFFHPILPVYIDTRKEGSAARFVRRSCRPNAILETYISDGREYHFWLVSDRMISANEQVTIPWDFRFPIPVRARMLRILGLDEEANTPPEFAPDDAEYLGLKEWLRLVLSEYGGCACYLGPDCAFVRFHRNHMGKSQSRTNPAKSKKRKSRGSQAISPTSTGQATNSRAASEGLLDDLADQDARSLSGSSRDKPPSRDLTPTVRQGSFDTLGILTEPTDRDKRKVHMIEDTFRRMELQQHQQPLARKKKRNSESTVAPRSKVATTKSNAAAQSPVIPDGISEHHYIDAGTVRSKSSSPAVVSPRTADGGHDDGGNSRAIAATCRPVSYGPGSDYVDADVQTEAKEAGAWYKEPSPSFTPRKRVVSLPKRLLEIRHRQLLEEEVKRKQQELDSQSVVMDVDDADNMRLVFSSAVPVPDVGQSAIAMSPTPAVESEVERADIVLPCMPCTTESTDVLMPDAPPAQTAEKSEPATGSATDSAAFKSPKLRLHLPPAPAFESCHGLSASTVALSAVASVGHSPLSVGGLASHSHLPMPQLNGLAANPSPVKKKMSLSDYTSRRVNRAQSIRPVLGASFKSAAGPENAKATNTVENGGLVASPTAESGREIRELSASMPGNPIATDTTSLSGHLNQAV